MRRKIHARTTLRNRNEVDSFAGYWTIIPYKNHRPTLSYGEFPHRNVIQKVLATKRKIVSIWYINKCTAKPYKQPETTDLTLTRNSCSTIHTSIPEHGMGIDIFGHIWVNRSKRWVLLVQVDLVIIQAIDLEILYNMKADTIALVFQNVRYSKENGDALHNIR